MFAVIWIDAGAYQAVEIPPCLVVLALLFVLFVVVLGSKFAGIVGVDGQPCARCGRRFEAWHLVVQAENGEWYHPACYPRKEKSR